MFSKQNESLHIGFKTLAILCRPVRSLRIRVKGNATRHKETEWKTMAPNNWQTGWQYFKRANIATLLPAQFVK